MRRAHSDQGRACVRAGLIQGAICAVLVSFAPDTHAEQNVAITALYASDWYYHGTSETLGRGAIGLNLQWSSDAWFAGIEGHQADEDGVESRQRQRAVMVYAGRRFVLSSLWHGSLSVSQREFPGSTKEWDYTEVQLVAAHRNGFQARLDYSPDYYEHDAASLGLTLRWLRPLGERAYGYVEAGALTLEERTRWQGHEFASAGVGLNWRSINGDLSYRWNSEGQSNNFGREDYSPSQFVLELAWRVR